MNRPQIFLIHGSDRHLKDPYPYFLKFSSVIFKSIKHNIYLLYQIYSYLSCFPFFFFLSWIVFDTVMCSISKISIIFSPLQHKIWTNTNNVLPTNLIATFFARFFYLLFLQVFPEFFNQCNVKKIENRAKRVKIRYICPRFHSQMLCVLWLVLGFVVPLVVARLWSP